LHSERLSIPGYRKPSMNANPNSKDRNRIAASVLRPFFSQMALTHLAKTYIMRANFKSSQDSEVRIQNKTEFEFKFNSVS